MNGLDIIIASEFGGFSGDGDYEQYKALMTQIVDCTITEIKEADLRGVTKIGQYAFYNKPELTSVYLCDGITEIATYGLYGNKKLTSVRLPETLIRIGSYSLGGETMYETIDIPESVQEIDNYAFTRNSSLRVATFHGTPTRVSSNSFATCSSLTTLNVPWSAGEVSGAPWGSSKATINYNYTGG